MATGIGATSELDILKLILANVTDPLVGDAIGLIGSTTAGNLYLALHTSSPGSAGNQTTNEAAYTGYARIPISRATGSWTFSASNPAQGVNTNATAFALCSGGSAETETDFSLGTALSGAGKILFYGPLGASVPVTPGVTTPTVAAGAVVCTLK